MPGRIAAISCRALFLAVALPTDDTARVARWLYRYGTLPREPEVERDFGPGDDPIAVLGLTPGGIARQRLDSTYEATTYPGWLGFARAPAPGEAPAGYKLYVSPRPEALATAFPVIAAVFAAMGVRAFKVGRSLEGLLRPDKIVAYFNARPHLDEVAAALSTALADCPAQGVPFTAEVGADGLLSWGTDPPAGGSALSWRSWVTRQVATALMATRPAIGEDAVAAALRTVATAGVDPVEWTVDRRAFARVQAP
jgi:hypothetical protein